MARVWKNAFVCFHYILNWPIRMKFLRPVSGHLVWQLLKGWSWRTVKLNTILQCIICKKKNVHKKIGHHAMPIFGVLTLVQHWFNTQVSTVEVLLLAQRRSFRGFWVVGPMMAQHMLANCNRVIFVFQLCNNYILNLFYDEHLQE